LLSDKTPKNEQENDFEPFWLGKREKKRELSDFSETEEQTGVLGN